MEHRARETIDQTEECSIKEEAMPWDVSSWQPLIDAAQHCQKRCWPGRQRQHCGVQRGQTNAQHDSSWGSYGGETGDKAEDDKERNHEEVAGVGTVAGDSQRASIKPEQHRHYTDA